VPFPLLNTLTNSAVNPLQTLRGGAHRYEAVFQWTIKKSAKVIGRTIHRVCNYVKRRKDISFYENIKHICFFLGQPYQKLMILRLSTSVSS
jgi:hypothetical protein